MDGKKSLPADPLEKLTGIGPAFQKTLSRLELLSIHDLLHHYPTRYLDYRKNTQIKDLLEKQEVSFTAIIGQPKRFMSRTGKLIIQAEAKDNTGKVKLTWFNTPYITRVINPGQKYLIAGKTSYWGERLTLVAPVIEPKGRETIHTKGLVPIYPLTAKLTSRFLRQKINLALASTLIKDPLTELQINKLRLIGYRESLRNIHFPKEYLDQKKADERLAFNHHLAINLNNQIELNKLPPSPVMTIDEKLHQNLTKSLPFKLTKSQMKAIRAGYLDLTKNHFTHRLIQGETGSGKTIVIFYFAAQTLANKKSFCLLAPTEILAQQHYQSFLKFGLPEKQLFLVTGRNPIRVIPKKPAIFIGTHALLTQLSGKLDFPLAAIAVDEQHKFGVDQRQALTKRNPSPHLFNLTATPIPRTLALGLFGEVAITTLKQKPKNRLPVKTWIVSPTRYRNSTPWIKEQLKNGSKVFVVAPLIRAENKLKETESVEKIYQEYQTRYASTTDIFLIHGQMPGVEIDRVMDCFKKAGHGILVSTSIIEVGVDIPEADIIIIHSAERFGLASLHQLRGRVGRGEHQGFCLLVPSTDELEEEERLQLLEKYHSGLTLAKMDLRLRGGGELFGTKQHGWLPVRLASFWNKKLFAQAKETAKEIIQKTPKEASDIANRLLTW